MPFNAGTDSVVRHLIGGGAEKTVAHHHHFVAGNHAKRCARVASVDIVDKGVDCVVDRPCIKGRNVTPVLYIGQLVWRVRLGSDHLGYSVVIVVAVVINALSQSFGYGWQVVVTKPVIAAAHKQERDIGKSGGNTRFWIGLPAQVAVEPELFNHGFWVEA